MKKFVIKSLCLFIPIFLLVIATNFMVDPANIFRSTLTDDMMEAFENHEGVEIVGDFNEGELLKKRIEALDRTPDTIVMGSSHVLYVDWQFEDYINAGMSGEFLDDYFATVGLLEEYGRLPRRLVISVDPYIFMSDLSIRQDSLLPYAEKEKALTRGEKYTKKLDSGISWERLKELVSFPYFQSSVSALTHGVNAATVIPTDDISVGEKTKILRNGKRVPAAAAFQSAQQCVWDAEWYVSTGTIHVMTDFSELSKNETEEWEQLTDYLISKGITLEIYLPSWLSVYYDEFEKNEKFSGVIKCEDYIRKMAAERNITVHGSYSPYVSGAENEYFLDSHHLTPKHGWENYNFILE